VGGSCGREEESWGEERNLRRAYESEEKWEYSIVDRDSSKIVVGEKQRGL